MIPLSIPEVLDADLASLEETGRIVCDSMTVSHADRVHAWLMRIVAALIVAYWVEFFTGGRVRTSEEQAYVDFERAFVLSDGYMVAAFLLAARRLAKGRPEAVGVGIAAGSAMTFLGGMDLLYNLQHGKFRDRTPEMAVETVIVAFSLVFGPATMLRMWKARRRLGA